MKTYDEIRAVIDGHTQMRHNTCFQSAVEMVLKLYGILGIEEYPEQALHELDGQGFAPYSATGLTKIYNGTTVSFEEVKYEPLSPAARARGIQLLNQDIYPIYALMIAGNHHEFIGIPDAVSHIQFITKAYPGKANTIIQSAGLLDAQVKTEILLIRPI